MRGDGFHVLWELELWEGGKQEELRKVSKAY